MASDIAVREVAAFLDRNAAFERALLVAFRASDAQVIRQALQRLSQS